MVFAEAGHHLQLQNSHLTVHICYSLYVKSVSWDISMSRRCLCLQVVCYWFTERQTEASESQVANNKYKSVSHLAFGHCNLLLCKPRTYNLTSINSTATLKCLLSLPMDTPVSVGHNGLVHWVRGK